MRILKFYLIIGVLFLTVPVCANINIFDFPINDLIYSKKHNKIFGVVGCMHKEYGNCLVQLNAETGNVEKSLFVGSNPNKVKLTTDEDYVYIAFESIGFIKRISLYEFIIDQEIFLGPVLSTTGLKSTILSNDFVIIPNTNNTIVVCRHTEYSNSDFIDLVMYKDGILQPKTIPNWISPEITPTISKIVTNNDGTRLYGYSSEVAPSDFYVINVHEDGLSFQKTYKDLISGYCSIRSKNDTVYARNGELIIGFPDDPQLVRNENLYNGYHSNGEHYGYLYSEIHKGFVYQRYDNNALYFNFYSGDNFENVDSVFISIPEEMEEFPYLIRNMAVLDEKRFVFILVASTGEHVLVFASTELSDDSSLKELSVEKLLIEPKFSSSVFEYDVESRNGYTSDIVAIPTHRKATVEYNEEFTAPGITHIEVTAQDRTTKNSYFINFNLPTNIDIIENTNKCQFVYPNPTTGILYVNEIENVRNIKIYSNLGVLKRELKENQLTGYIDFTDEQVGIYNLMIELKNGSFISQRIIKL